MRTGERSSDAFHAAIVLGPLGTERKVTLERFMGLRLMTGQSKRRDEVEMRNGLRSD